MGTVLKEKKIFSSTVTFTAISWGLVSSFFIIFHPPQILIFKHWYKNEHYLCFSLLLKIDFTLCLRFFFLNQREAARFKIEII